MKRLRDCFTAPVIPEAKLVLAALVSGRLKEATSDEVMGLIGETRGVVDYAFESLRVARINVSDRGSRLVLAKEWTPDVQGESKEKVKT